MEAERPYRALMNFTISIDDQTLERVRAIARRRGVSVQDMLRQYLESLAVERSLEQTTDELLGLMTEHGGRSGGKRITRDEAYRDRA